MTKSHIILERSFFFLCYQQNIQETIELFSTTTPQDDYIISLFE